MDKLESRGRMSPDEFRLNMMALLGKMDLSVGGSFDNE